MSEGSDSKWGTAFFLGFLLGVFVCLGAGGTFVVVLQRRALMEAEQATEMAAEAERRARMEAARALELEAERTRAEGERARKEAEATKGAKKGGE